jgi:hypothetical protein
VIGKCLEKNPVNRFASGEELALALESVAVSSASPAGVQLKKHTPLVLRGYAMATSLLVLGLSATLAHGYLHNAFVLPAPPKRILAAPKPPEQLPSTMVQAPGADEADQPTVRQASDSQKMLRKNAAKSNRGNRLVLPLSTFVAAKLVPDVVSPTPTADPKPSDDAHKAGEAQLTIEIATKSMEDTLAVFADHKILFRFSLAGAYGDDAIPIRRVFTLPSGPHEFSVGLYKDDKTLRSNKEGLGELRAGENNVLAIHVAKHSKFLLGPGLNVTWPSDAEHAKSQRPPRSPATPLAGKVSAQAVLPNESNR